MGGLPPKQSNPPSVKLLRKKIHLRKAKSRPRKVFVLLAHLVSELIQLPESGRCTKVWILSEISILILAPAKGRVCETSQQANLGYLLEIDHGNGYVSSSYGHLDSFAEQEGDWTQEG
jgi:hypothetical protein